VKRVKRKQQDSTEKQNVQFSSYPEGKRSHGTGRSASGIEPVPAVKTLLSNPENPKFEWQRLSIGQARVSCVYGINISTDKRWRQRSDIYHIVPGCCRNGYSNPAE